MSKQSQAKQIQGYLEKPLPRTCMNCREYASDLITRTHAYGQWTDEKNKRCTLGKFAVRKTATCNLWSQRVQS